MKKYKLLTFGLLICVLGIFPAIAVAEIVDPPPGGGPCHVYACDFEFWGYLTQGDLSNTHHNDGKNFVVAPSCIPIPSLPPVYWFLGFIDFIFPDVYADKLLLDYRSFLYASDVIITYTNGITKTYVSLNPGYREISLDSSRRVRQISFRYWKTGYEFYFAEIKVDQLVLVC